MEKEINSKLQFALSALVGHCKALLADGQLSREEEQKLQKLIREIEAALDYRQQVR